MFKKLNILLVVLAVICLAAGVCGAQDQLADIKNAGVLRFGVSSDYYPFVYTEGLELDGLDIAMVKEMGSRLGVTVQPIDMAFDGLIDAVMIGQVDLIGGGFSITESRKEKVDFTNAYFAAVQSRPGCSAISTDTCVPISRLADCLLDSVAEADASGIPYFLVGHVGDGNIHANLMYDARDADLARRAVAVLKVRPHGAGRMRAEAPFARVWRERIVPRVDPSSVQRDCVASGL